MGLYHATCLARQCNTDPSKSVRLAIWLDEQAWELFGLERVRLPIAKPWEGHLEKSSGGACGKGLCPIFSNILQDALRDSTTPRRRG